MEVLQGDLDDRASLGAALQGVYAVFSVQSFAQKGKALADAAKAAGVQHFVYTSPGGAERSTGVTNSRANGRSNSTSVPGYFLSSTR